MKLLNSPSQPAGQRPHRGVVTAVATNVRCITIFVLTIISLFAVDSFAQVKIRERVEITPRAATPTAGIGSSAMSGLCDSLPPTWPLPPLIVNGPPYTERVSICYDESAVLWPCYGCQPTLVAGSVVQGAEYMHLELLGGAPGDGGHVSGSEFHYRQTSGYSVRIVFDGAMPTQCTVVRVHQQLLWFGGDNNVFLEFTLVPPRIDSIMANIASPSVESGSFTDIDISPSVRCNGGAAATYSANIVSGGEYGAFIHPTNADTVATFSGVPFGTVRFVANGVDPDSAVKVRMNFVASDASVPPIDTTITVLPGPSCTLVTLSPSQISPGDTAIISLRKLKADGRVVEFPPNQLFYVEVDPHSPTQEYVGKPYSPLRPTEIDDIYAWVDSVRQEGLMFVAADSIQADSALFDIYVDVYGSDEGNLYERPGVGKSADEKLGLQSTKRGKHTLSSISCSIDPWVLKKKEFSILLGETKYYQAKPDPNDAAKLVIEELATPTLDGGIASDVWGTNPVTEISGGKVGVYWEKKKPDGEDLPVGLIRLIGRYWEENVAYKVRLSATNGTRSGSIEIEVKKPSKLLSLGQSPTYEKTRDINNQVVSIDDSCIVYGGKFGIPPQFIKGHMLQEAGIQNFGGEVGTGFAPTYVYEPYTGGAGQFGDWKGWRYVHGMWVVDPARTTHKMGLGKEVPTHSHVQDFSYPTEPQTVWDMIRNHSQLVEALPGKDHTKYGKRVNGFMDFYPASYRNIQRAYDKCVYRAQVAKFHFPFIPETIAEISRGFMIQYLRDEWRGLTRNGPIGAQNMVAQTRLASSYGLLQFTFATAVEKVGYPNNNSEKSPEDLNETTTNLFWSMYYYMKLLGTVTEQESSWPEGFETTFKNRVWSRWNGRGMKYANEVYPKTLLFKPQR
ncbi:MAG: hypothetical protein HY961_10345 [Ignavibacteriae bacterium]|nr:hypothetical protein [Ignavibacteriota bacterium]